MAAFSKSCLLRPRWRAGALLVTGLFACSTAHRPQPILAERCLAVSATMPINFGIPAREGGALRIAVAQRGISLTAALIEGTTSAATISPMERYGQMTFLVESRSPHSYRIRILSRDSAEITGEACISAERLDGTDRIRLSAERAFAAAGRATFA